LRHIRGIQSFSLHSGGIRQTLDLAVGGLPTDSGIRTGVSRFGEQIDIQASSAKYKYQSDMVGHLPQELGSVG
jgi:hypothetical protein